MINIQKEYFVIFFFIVTICVLFFAFIYGRFEYILLILIIWMIISYQLSFDKTCWP